jgi:antitoxin component of RelBE/YafQ-DinJ toxin-antitoxin module
MILMMKRNVGRPPVIPTPGGQSSITMKIPSEFKQQVLDQSQAYGMTITEYIQTLVDRDAA